MLTTVATSVRELMTTKDVENEYGIPEGTLRYYRSTGVGPASFRLGGRVRYRRTEVLNWVAEQERTTRRGGAGTQQSAVDAT
jgi:DNA-binding transcriptional MerR regulator